MTKWPVIKLRASISELPLGLRVIDRREANEGESTGQTGCRYGHRKWTGAGGKDAVRDAPAIEQTGKNETRLMWRPHER